MSISESDKSALEAGISNDVSNEASNICFSASLPVCLPAKTSNVAKTRIPNVLSVAGTDPCGGAGIQTDIKSITACGGYALTAITSVVSQNTCRVANVFPLPREVVYSQLKSVTDDVPVDVVKLDMGFMRSAVNEDRGGVVLGSVIRMLQGLDTPIIAEGVETLEQAELLKNMGCHLMQGFHFARPMPLEDFESYIASNNTDESSLKRTRRESRIDELTSFDPTSSFVFNNVIGGTMFFVVKDGFSESILAFLNLKDVSFVFAFCTFVACQLSFKLIGYPCSILSFFLR